VNLLELQSDPAAFRAVLLIDTDGGPRRLGDCLDLWQRDDFAALDPGWMRAVVGTEAEAQYQRGWLERPRGHAKTLDLGVMATWALFASRRRLSGIGAAGDQDQARLLRDAIGRLLYVNPWLSSILEVQAYRVVNGRTQSTLEIITSDAPTSYGLTPDFVIADEVVHWRKRDLWDSLISSAAKRSTCLFVSITNAGLQDDWTWQAREAVRKDPGWYFRRLDGPCASWITPDRLAEQERLLPSIAYRRLWLNEWSSGGGDALRPSDIEAAFSDVLGPMTGTEPSVRFCAGVDLGLTHDNAAVVVLGVPVGTDRGRSIRLAHHKLWRPTPGRKLDLMEVETYILALDKQFDLEEVAIDVWQAELLAQRLEVNSEHRARNARRRFWTKPWIRPVPATGANLREQATLVIESFADRRFLFFRCEPLRRDLLRLRVEDRSYGLRLVSPRDGDGHGDSFSAFALALPIAHDLAGRNPAPKATAFCEGMSAGSDPLGRAIANLAAKNREREEEYEYAKKHADENNDWYKAMVKCGRADPPAESDHLFIL
jgi:hypothetical protein